MLELSDDSDTKLAKRGEDRMIDYVAGRADARPVLEVEGIPYTYLDPEGNTIDAQISIYKGPSGRYYLLDEDIDTDEAMWVGRQRGYSTILEAVRDAEIIAEALAG